MEKYEGPAEIYVQGRLLAEATKCTVRVKGNNNPVMTMKKGLAGKSDGPTTSEATIESAVPRRGYETDFVRHVNDKTTISLVVKSGGQRHQFLGWFEDTEWSNATDAPTAITANFTGGPPKSLGG